MGRNSAVFVIIIRQTRYSCLVGMVGSVMVAVWKLGKDMDFVRSVGVNSRKCWWLK